MKLLKKIEDIDLNDYPILENNASITYYIRLNKRYGLKLYKIKADRDGCFIRQKAAYALDIAPKPIGQVDKDHYYGYVTEHAEETRLTNVELKYLKSVMSEMFWFTDDVEPDRNVGRINGKPVLIDFDDGTLEKAYI